jgi:hypothetical protein
MLFSSFLPQFVTRPRSSAAADAPARQHLHAAGSGDLFLIGWFSSSIGKQLLSRPHWRNISIG